MNHLKASNRLNFQIVFNLLKVLLNQFSSFTIQTMSVTQGVKFYIFESLCFKRAFERLRCRGLNDSIYFRNFDVNNKKITSP
jgi:hypothetical protein